NDGHHPAAAYLDDVVVHSEAWEDHLDRLQRVLSELQRAGLTANPRKCHLALSEAKYLGFQVGRGLIRPQDFSCPFLLQTDASDTGLGAVLSQVQEGEEHQIIYISRKLSPAERNYATVEREALAIKWAVLELRYYLLGCKFTLVTDHAPLQWMARAKDTNARVTHWFLVLQDFHFEVRHRAGATNANADRLSRIWTAYAGLSGVIPHPPLISPLLSPFVPRARTTLWGGRNVTSISGLISVALATIDLHLHVLITADQSPLLPNQQHGFISRSFCQSDRRSSRAGCTAN
ncbi:hypothetical protein M9458_057675, partial [Cirrhinus mrigala]